MKRIDLRYLRRAGLLLPGQDATLSWTCYGEPTGSITIIPLKRGLLLAYQVQQDIKKKEWREVSENIPFIWTRTNFGGRRRWFKCLGCGRRCSVLYGGTYFRCRLCYRLGYYTQYEPSWVAPMTKSQKIRMRLGGSGSLDEPFPFKPKGMHWKNYRRLEAIDLRGTHLFESLLLGLRTEGAAGS